MRGVLGSLFLVLSCLVIGVLMFGAAIAESIAQDYELRRAT